MGPLDDVADALGGQFEGLQHGSRDRLDLFRGFRSVLSDRLTLLVVEDVHWADQATWISSDIWAGAWSNCRCWWSSPIAAMRSARTIR
jgi:hypothetical protein